MMHVMVGEAGAVVADGGFFQHDALGERAGPHGGVLRRHALLHAFGRVAHLEQARVLGVGGFVGVDFGRDFRAGVEEAVCHAFFFLMLVSFRAKREIL